METAIKDMPQFHKYKDTLCEYVQKPDYDDTGFWANKHFYFGEKIEENDFSQKSFENEPIEKYDNVIASSQPGAFKSFFSTIFNTNGVSFMDYSKQNNAKYAYNEQIKLLEDAIEDEDKQKAMQSVGRACHFLQDLAQPQHTQKESTLGKFFNLKTHIDFENYTQNNTDKIFENLKINNEKHRSNTQLFSDTFIKSNPIEISKNNKNEWGNIAKNQINLAVQSTKEFLKNAGEKIFNNSNES